MTSDFAEALVAFAMVALGMGTGSVYTALDLEEGLEYLNSSVPTRACLQRICRWVEQAGTVDRTALLDDAQWDLIEPLLPPQRSGKGRPMREHRQVVEGVIYRYRCGIAWRDLTGLPELMSTRSGEYGL